VVDRIELVGLKVDALIGVYPHEEKIHQRLVVDVRLEADLGPAGRSDAVEDTVDYDAVARIVRSVAKERHHRLIERVAARIAEDVLAGFGGQVGAVEVRVSKPGAVPDAGDVAVEIRRTSAGLKA
jgi:dihydroneopterin aldolase